MFDVVLQRKWQFFATLAHRFDTILLLDTHSADFESWDLVAKRDALGLTPVFTHHSTHQAGVAVLLRNSLFEHNWIGTKVLVEGRSLSVSFRTA